MDLSVSDAVPVEDSNFSFRNHSDFIIDLRKTVLNVDDYKGIEDEKVYMFKPEHNSDLGEVTISLEKLHNLKCSCGDKATLIIDNQNVKCDNCAGNPENHDVKHIELIIGSMYETAKELRTQAFSVSLFYQYAEQFCSLETLHKYTQTLSKNTHSLDESLTELSNTQLSTVEDVVKWAFKVDELKSLFFESDDFKAVSLESAKHIAKKLTSSIAKHQIMQ